MPRSPWHFIPYLLPVAIVAIATLLLPSTPLQTFFLTLLAILPPASLIIRRERKKNAQLVERNRLFAQNLIDVIPQPFYVKDRDSRYLMVNTAFAEARNTTKEALIGVSALDLAPSAQIREKVRKEDAAALSGFSIHQENHDTDIYGQERYQLVMKGSCQNADGQRVIVGANFDLTPWRLAEKNLESTLALANQQRENTEAFIQQLIDLIPDPVYLKNGESRFLMVNEALARERGCHKTDLVGLTSFDLAPDPQTAETSAREDREVIGGGEITKEQRAHTPLTGDECYRVVIKRRCIGIDGQPVVFGLHHYITRWKIAELEYRHLAEKDPLTGLANRRFFNQEALHALEYAHESGKPLSIALLDLDHFKGINDEYGHPIGDEVLNEVVSRSLSCLRRSDLMGRWGGEEFILLLPESALEQACAVAERVRTSIAREPFRTSQATIPVTISCGIAQYMNGDDLDSLIRRADRSLYTAKNSGRNRIVSAPAA